MCKAKCLTDIPESYVILFRLDFSTVSSYESSAEHIDSSCLLKVLTKRQHTKHVLADQSDLPERFVGYRIPAPVMLSCDTHSLYE